MHPIDLSGIIEIGVSLEPILHFVSLLSGIISRLWEIQPSNVTFALKIVE